MTACSSSRSLYIAALLGAVGLFTLPWPVGGSTKNATAAPPAKVDTSPPAASTAPLSAQLPSLADENDTAPSGRPFGSVVMRPEAAAMPLRACSVTLPLCVYAPAAASSGLMATLTEAETAFRFMRTAGLPYPAADVNSTGSPTFDLYLHPALGAPYRLGFGAAYTSPRDVAAAFGLLDASLAPGCFRRTAIHRLVASALLAALDAGESPGAFASTATYLAMRSTGCLGPVLSAIDRAQAHPERSMLPTGAVDDAEASPLLPWYLDAAFGAGPPGQLLAALWLFSGQTTPPTATHFYNQPDLFTTLASVARGRQRVLADFLIDAAVGRAFLGDRDDGTHWPGAPELGALGRPRFDASFAYATLKPARNFAFTPLEPTGVLYAWVDLKTAPHGARLGLRAVWEPPVTMRWAAARVGDDGRELSRVDIAYEPTVQSVERRVLELDGAAGLLIVGVNVGEGGPGHPYRVDETPYEPHGGTLLVTSDVDLPLYQENPTRIAQPRATS